MREREVLVTDKRANANWFEWFLLPWVQPEHDRAGRSRVTG